MHFKVFAPRPQTYFFNGIISLEEELYFVKGGLSKK